MGTCPHGVRCPLSVSPAGGPGGYEVPWMGGTPVAPKVQAPREGLEHRGPRNPPRALRCEAVRSVSLCEALPVRTEDQRDVQRFDGRTARAQERAQEKLAARGRPQVVAPHDTGDALDEVIDRDRELVRPQPVRTPEHEISDPCVNILLEGAESPVDVSYDVVRLGSKTDRRRAASRALRTRTAGSRVSRRFVVGPVGS